MAQQSETFRIEGMTCGHCVMAVRNALQEKPGIEVEQVEIGSAQVRYDPDQLSRSEIVEAIEEEGYRVAA